jgi:hypothetical protein
MMTLSLLLPWTSISLANLYDNHWLIAYEAWEQGWLASPTGRDYIADDELFSILRLHGVRFYGGVAVSTASSFSY